MSCEFQIMRLAYDEFQKKVFVIQHDEIKMDYWYIKNNSLFVFWLYHDIENENFTESINDLSKSYISIITNNIIRITNIWSKKEWKIYL